MKPNENFIKVISQLNEVADYYINENGDRAPMCIMARAMRTIIRPDITNTFKYDSISELVYDVKQAIIEFIIKNDVDYKWFIERNFCIPELTDNEIENLKQEIDLIRKINNK